MFSFTSCCGTMAVWTLMMMMMMMMMIPEAGAMPKAAKPHKKTSEETQRIETVHLQLDPEVFNPVQNVRPLHNASISPWTYNVSRDESVFPPVLAEARCLLQGCLTSEGHEDQNLKSHPIMHQILVLRRVRPAGAGLTEGAGNAKGAGQGYHYRLEFRTVAVGCTCVRPSVMIQY